MNTDINQEVIVGGDCRFIGFINNCKVEKKLRDTFLMPPLSDF